MAAQQPLLEFQDVAKTYGQRIIFRHVNAALFSGSITLLAGDNGSGKSTLMRLAAGLTSPDMGRVSRRVPLARTGYMAHATFLYPGLEARENLLFWAKASGIAEPAKKVTEVLEITGLSRSAFEKAGVFSRGMAQRLNLARLLLSDPLLILLDEPATGLDVSSRTMLEEVVCSARKRGAAVLWISHNIKEDSRHADRLLVLNSHTLGEEELPSC
ncbi:MAG: ABC transporter ATP-binding protein [Mailhella sp.]|nr:ABC transporter ATP-binding protein [Mailhella sp.]